MKLFDSHCHFETRDPEKIRAILRRARTAGVESLMAVGGSRELNETAVLARQLAAADPTLPHVSIALGYDREQLTDAERPVWPAENPAALGEIGLDYHYSPETRSAQLALFESQLAQARERNLPVVIHTREADDDTVALLKAIPVRGIIHCYTGTPEGGRRFLDLGFFISFSGIVTFKSAQTVRDSARIVPGDRLLIETDAPFLAPVPLRGKENEPAFIVHTCAFLANLRGESPKSLAAHTFENATRIINPRGCTLPQSGFAVTAFA